MGLSKCADDNLRTEAEAVCRMCYNISMSEYNEEFDGMSISEISQRSDGWTFLVELGHGDTKIEYMVDLDKDYWTRLTDQRIEPVKLVEATFKFLLDREAKEMILRKFNLADVSGHFPNYEVEIKRLL